MARFTFGIYERFKKIIRGAKKDMSLPDDWTPEEEELFNAVLARSPSIFELESNLRDGHIIFNELNKEAIKELPHSVWCKEVGGEVQIVEFYYGFSQWFFWDSNQGNVSKTVLAPWEWGWEFMGFTE